MTHPAHLGQPPGWYADPAGQARMRYWDGQHWTSSTSNAKHPTAGRAGLGSGFASLGDWLGRLLAGCGITSALLLVVVGWGYSVLSPYAGSVGSLVTPDSPTLTPALQTQLGHVLLAFIVVFGIDSLLRLVTGITWLVWQAQLAGAAPGPLRRSAGMQVAAWFIPFVNWVWPYQDVNNLWRAYGTTRAETTGAAPASVLAWWLSYLGGGFLAGLLIAWALAGGPAAVVTRISIAYGALFLSQAVAAYLARDVVRKLSWHALVFHASAR